MRSALALIFGSVLLLYTAFSFLPRWTRDKSEAIISWDVAGYYWYLPSAFIYHDLRHQRFDDSVSQKYQMAGGNPVTHPYGHGRVLQYSCGMAVLYSPAFFAAHALAIPLGFISDGFSPPYQFAILLWSVLAAILGLWMYRHFLLRYFSDGVVAVTLIVLVVGTNYLDYASAAAAMTHSWLFTLYAALLLATRRFYELPSTRRALLVGALIGLATLVRPTDAISALIPLLWGLEGVSRSALKSRFSFFSKQRGPLAAAVFVSAAIISIQLFYWKYATGHWVVYSYGDQGFTFLPPHALDFTFSYRSGWLTYTPIMWAALFGIIPFLRRGPNRVVAIGLAAVAFYIASAWDIWWYAGTSGRAMIQYYPVLFIVVASLLEWLARTRWVKWATVPLFLLATFVNFWWFWHAHYGGLFDAESGMTKAYFWRVIGRWKVPPETAKLKDTDELFQGAPNAQAVITRATAAFATDTSQNLAVAGEIKQRFPADYIPAGYEWLRLAARIQCPEKEWNVWQMGQMGICYFNDQGEKVKERFIRIQRHLEQGDTKTLFIDVRLPEKTFTAVECYFLQSSKRALLIDSIRVIALR